jgi:acid stress chaperone HdeB
VSAMNTGSKRLNGAIVIATALLFVGPAWPARAQVVVEMSRVTCRQFIDYPFEAQEEIGAWMSGYFNAAHHRKILDITRYRANSERVIGYCKKHKNDTLMNAIEKVAL